MKRAASTVLLLAAGLVGCLWVTTAFAAESYTMVCKGGGGMWIQHWNAPRSTLEIHFSRASVAASRGEPGPGQCAWVDRPIRLDEPDWMSLGPLDYNPLGRLRIDASGISVISSSGSAMTIINAVKSGSVFYVRARNSRRGYFEVTHIGP